MFILYYLLWILFNGRVTVEILLIGLPLCAALYLFTVKFLDISVKDDLRRLKKLPGILGYLAYLLKEVITSALHVMKMILNPKTKLRPELRTFRTGLGSESGNVILSDSITLTPGTITVLAEGDKLTVHCLDTSTGEGIEDNEMLRRVKKLEGEGHASSL